MVNRQLIVLSSIEAAVLTRIFFAFALALLGGDGFGQGELHLGRASG